MTELDEFSHNTSRYERRARVIRMAGIAAVVVTVGAGGVAVGTLLTNSDAPASPISNVATVTAVGTQPTASNTQPTSSTTAVVATTGTRSDPATTVKSNDDGGTDD